LKKHVHILSVASPNIFDETISAIHSVLEDWDYRVTYENAFKIKPAKPFSQYANIIFRAQRHFDMAWLPPRSKKILFQTEQYSKLRKFGTLPYSDPWDLILDVFKHNVERFAMCEVIRYMPIGYHRSFGYGVDAALRPEIADVYFFGAGTRYRRETWGRLHLPYSQFANRDFGITKEEKIYSSKVNIFISAWEPYFLPMMHCMQIIGKGKFLLAIINDTKQDFSPFKEGLHFVAVERKRSKEALNFWLKKDSLRNHFAKKAYNSISSDHLFENYLEKALKGCIPKPSWIT
jgi:hypothetical protein